MTRLPDGQRQRPLSAHAIAELRDPDVAPPPRKDMNPDVTTRLNEEIVDLMMPSPFKTHAGRDIEHMRITPPGAAR